MRTRRKEAQASANRHAVMEALWAGRELRVSSKTDLDAGTVHSGTARGLVQVGQATYPPDPEREGWRDMTRIVLRPR